MTANKPDTISQEYWDTLSDVEKQFVINHERKHAELEAALDSENPKHISECGELDWHEVLDRAFLVADMFERHVFNHPVVQLHHELKARCDDLVDKLWGIYTSIPNYEEQAKKDDIQMKAWEFWANRDGKSYPTPEGFKRFAAMFPVVFGNEERDNTHPSVPKELLSKRVWKGEL